MKKDQLSLDSTPKMFALAQDLVGRLQGFKDLTSEEECHKVLKKLVKASHECTSQLIEGNFVQTAIIFDSLTKLCLLTVDAFIRQVAKDKRKFEAKVTKQAAEDREFAI